MTTPKPAPSKPLTFTPPQYLKGETKSSELPALERDTKLKKVKGHRPDIAIIDETINDDGGVTITLGVVEEPKKLETKKPFVLNPHLTQRPFHDDRLMQLKNRLQRPSFKNR